MSILIKGMEMPINCFLCPLSVLDENRLFCELTSDEVVRAKIDSDCPLVPVPPHGRLIDADEFEKKNAYYWGKDFINAKYEDCLCDLVNDAPTIIEAEVDDDER